MRVSLRFRLQLLVLLAILPGTVFFLFVLQQQHALMREHIADDMLRLARLASMNHERTTTAALGLVQAIAESPDVQREEALACRQALLRLRQASSSIRRVAVVRSDSSRVCEAAEGGADELPQADVLLVQQVKETGASRFGPYQVDEQLRSAVLDIASPLDQRAGQGKVLLVSIDVGWLEPFALRADMPRGAIISVIDGRGVVLGRFSDGGPSVGQKIEQEQVIRQLWAKQEGTVDIRCADGIRRLCGFATWHVRGQLSPAWVVVGVPDEVVSAWWKRMAQFWVLWMLIALAVSLIATFALAESKILAPVRGILNAVQAVSSGELKARTGVREPRDELGQLALAFDKMAGTIEQKVDALTCAEQDLRGSYARLQKAQTQVIKTEKLSAIGQMAAGIVHDLKNPLGIILQAETYLRRNTPKEHASHVEVLDMLREAVLRADRMVQGLLALSRPIEAKLESVYLNEEIETALRSALPTDGILIVRHYARESPRVKLDAEKFREALINVLVNAYQAMPEGGVLTISSGVEQLADPEVGVGRRVTDAFRPGQQVAVCEVSDTGSGISEENLAKIFEPFFSTKPKGQGTGLGLFMVRAILEAHQGRVSVHSQEGKGTTVRFLLPSAAPSGGKDGG